MAFNKEKIYNDCLELLENDKHNIRYIEELVAFLPISKATFYDFFKVESDELNTLKDLIDNNKVKVKCKLRNKFEISDNPTLNIIAFKTLANDDELDRLNNNRSKEIERVEDLPVVEINYTYK